MARNSNGLAPDDLPPSTDDPSDSTRLAGTDSQRILKHNHRRSSMMYAFAKL